MSTQMVRPTAVKDLDGKLLTFADLPPPHTTRWVVRRKAQVVAAVRGGLLTAAEACARYSLSPDELEGWNRLIERDGVPALRVTRLKLYRGPN